MQNEQFDNFKAVLRQLATELEDIWIEADAFRDFAIRMGIATTETLDQVAKKALAAPYIRERARQRFAQMHHALNQTAEDLWLSEFLHKPPRSDKPN